MTRTEIKLAGFGGQGIVLAGFILGKAISIYDKKNAILTQSYGPEARGGACSADVVTADGDIDFPEVTVPNISVIMSQEAFNKYGKNIKRNGTLLIDEDLVKIDAKDENAKNNKEKNIKIYSIPSTRYAEELGRKIVANIVMIGFVTAVTNIASLEGMKKSLLGSVPKGTEQLNMSALMKGYDYGSELIKSSKSTKKSK
jgi:2-oxoglutarate ferredoxin oxidoreductase subunit gamma